MKKLKYYILLASLALIATKCPDKNPPPAPDPCLNVNIPSAEFEVYYETTYFGVSKITNDTIIDNNQLSISLKDIQAGKNMQIAVNGILVSKYERSDGSFSWTIYTNRYSNASTFTFSSTVTGTSLPNTCNTKTYTKTFKKVKYWENPTHWGRYKVASTQAPLDSFYITMKPNPEAEGFELYNFKPGKYTLVKDALQLGFEVTNKVFDFNINQFYGLDSTFNCTSSMSGICMPSTLLGNNLYSLNRYTINNNKIFIKLSTTFYPFGNGGTIETISGILK